MVFSVLGTCYLLEGSELVLSFSLHSSGFLCYGGDMCMDMDGRMRPCFLMREEREGAP